MKLFPRKMVLVFFVGGYLPYKLKEDQETWYRANRTSVLAYKARWREKNKEQISAAKKAWCEANKEHCRNKAAAYHVLHAEGIRKRVKKWAEDNKDRAIESSAAYYKANRTEIKSRSKEWREDNPMKVNAFSAKRRADRMKATPKWANQFFMEEIYDLAIFRTKDTGYKWHVDHIVPLRSKLVCGLHCEQNLQVIPAEVNLNKGNGFII